MTRKWRPARVGLFLVGAWLFGAVAISSIISVEIDGSPAAPYVWGAWGLLLLGVSYFVACLALNTTSVSVVSGKLVVRSGPMPDWGKSETDLREIEEIFTTPVMTPGARGAGGYVYIVQARTKGGKTIPIFANTSIPEQSQADEIARQIEAMIWTVSS
jgi:hypothetical protein